MMTHSAFYISAIKNGASVVCRRNVRKMFLLKWKEQRYSGGMKMA